MFFEVGERLLSCRYIVSVGPAPPAPGHFIKMAETGEQVPITDAQRARLAEELRARCGCVSLDEPRPPQVVGEAAPDLDEADGGEQGGV